MHHENLRFVLFSDNWASRSRQQRSPTPDFLRDISPVRLSPVRRNSPTHPAASRRRSSSSPVQTGTSFRAFASSSSTQRRSRSQSPLTRSHSRSPSRRELSPDFDLRPGSSLAGRRAYNRNSSSSTQPSRRSPSPARRAYRNSLSSTQPSRRSPSPAR